MKIPRKKKTVTKPVYSVNPEELIFRDHLAADRTALANERTFLAYIRTALAFIAAGFGLIKFTTETSFIVMGWILVPIGRKKQFSKISPPMRCVSITPPVLHH